MEKKPEPHSDAETLFTAPPLPVAPLDDEQRLACLRLARSQNVGSVTFCELINQFGGAQQALDALPELARNGGRRARISICSQADAEVELEAATSCGARPLFTIEPGYPRAVALIDAPPPLIYVRGRDDLLQKPAVAIVGSRLASAAGLKLAAKFAHELGQAGLTICSGLARGIDGEAHRASLDSGTIAVVAGGVDIVYPPEHADLHQEIAEKGVVISMMPCRVPAAGQRLPTAQPADRGCIAGHLGDGSRSPIRHPDNGAVCRRAWPGCFRGSRPPARSTGGRDEQSFEVGCDFDNATGRCT